MPVANAALFSDDFANLNNWTVINGDWSVSGGVLQAVAPNQNCMIWAGDTAWTNYQLTTYGSKLNSGNVIGVVVRYTNPDNFYWMGLGCWGHKFSISKMFNGTGTELASFGLISEVEVGRWYMISAVVVDSTLQLFVDGVKVLEVQDSSLANGAVGFITYGGTMQAKQFSVQSSALDPNSWPMWRNDPSHSGYTTSIGPITNQTLWTFTTNASISDAVVANGIVYFDGGDGYFYALNASTGKQLWNKPGSTGIPAVANGIVYVTGQFNESGGSGGLYALNASMGEKIWNVTSYDTISPVGTPTVVEGRVYVGYGVFDAYTGNLIWTPLGQPITSNVYMDVQLHNPPVVNGIVYGRKQTASFIYALNRTNGNEIWHQSTGTGVYSGSAFTVVNGVAYFGDDFMGLNALNASTGEKIWRIAVQYTPWTGPYSFVMSTPAVVNGIAYIGVYGQMLAVNASTGEKIWNYTTGVGMRSSPAIASDVVYIGSGQSHFLDEARPYNILVDNKVYAFNTTTGNMIWSYQTDDSVDSSPAIAGGIVYVSSGGKLYAFGQLSTPTPSPTPIPTPSPTSSPTPTAAPSPSPSPTPTPTPTLTPTPTPTSTPTSTPTPSPTATPSPSPSSSPTPTASPPPNPSFSPSPSPSPIPTIAPTPTSTNTVTAPPVTTPNPSPSEALSPASPSPTLNQSPSTSPSPLLQSPGTPLYLYPLVVLIILAISISIIVLITKKKKTKVKDQELLIEIWKKINRPDDHIFLQGKKSLSFIKLFLF